MGRILSGWLAATIIPLLVLVIVGVIGNAFLPQLARPSSPESVPPSKLIMLVAFFVSNVACYAISIRYIVLGYPAGILRLICGWLGTYGFAFVVFLCASLLWMGLFKPWTGVSSMRESSPLDGWIFFGSYVFGSLVGYGLSARYIVDR